MWKVESKFDDKSNKREKEREWLHKKTGGEKILYRKQLTLGVSHNQKVVSLYLVSSNILDRNGVKAVPGSIPAPNLGLIIKKRKKIQ